MRVEIEAGTLVARRDEPTLRIYPIDYVPLTRETETVNAVGTGIYPIGETGSGRRPARRTAPRRV